MNRRQERTSMIWAQARGRVIGTQGVLPWSVPEDLDRFRRLTAGYAVVMGRATWDSLPTRPLPERHCVVLTRDPRWSAPGAQRAGSLHEALVAGDGHKHTWIIGGGQVYALAMELDVAGTLVVTDIDLDVEGDTKAPVIDPQRWVPAYPAPQRPWAVSTSGAPYRTTTYTRRLS